VISALTYFYDQEKDPLVNLLQLVTFLGQVRKFDLKSF